MGNTDFSIEVGLEGAGLPVFCLGYRLLIRSRFGNMEDKMNNNGENYEGVDEIDVIEDENINEGNEFDFEEIDSGSLKEDGVKKYKSPNNDIAYNFYKMYERDLGDKKNELVRKRLQEKKRDEEKCDWYVSYFVDDHNHELIGEHYGGMIASNRSMNTMREVEIGTGKIFGSFTGQCGGYRYIGFSNKDMNNQIQKQRRIGNGDAESALQYLKEQSKSDSAMYWRHSVDEEGKLQQLFWADGCNIFDYSIFGDVLAFDATYGRNKYKFSVVIFSGVNHHKQTTVFAVGIVSNETEETYV
ncbi:hypothetical protein Lal_00018880 [Lupinus albus]|nr:hypothetical protein Lal_00018880 [Lupinus albus]